MILWRNTNKIFCSSIVDQQITGFLIFCFERIKNKRFLRPLKNKSEIFLNSAGKHKQKLIKNIFGKKSEYAR